MTLKELIKEIEPSAQELDLPKEKDFDQYGPKLFFSMVISLKRIADAMERYMSMPND